jgi:pimeloyl-ACP methyl ester carboxylesterase
MRKVIGSVLRRLGLSRSSRIRDPLVRWMVVEGVRIRCLDTGSKTRKGPVLLMVHGWGGSGEDFRPLFGRLPQNCRAIAIDLPGCGRSDKPDAAYDVAYFVSFLKALCDAMGLEKIVLVGHSMGGLFAVHFVGTHPEMVDKLVLVAPYGLRAEDGVWSLAARWGNLVDLVLRFNNRLFIRWALQRNIFYKPTARMVRAAVVSGSGVIGRLGSRALAHITRNAMGKDHVESVLPFIRQDTLLIWGNRDKVLAPRFARTFMELLPRACLRSVRDSGHVPMVEKTAETARLFSEFITLSEPGGA